MEHRDSPEIEPEQAVEARTTSRRRFASLVDSPAARRVALPRLIVAGVLTLAVLALLVLVVSNLLQSATRWVDHRPEHQIRFSEIELNPPPDPWVVGGKPRLLEEIRTGSKLGETVSLLDLDLKELEKAFRLCPWVKDVLRVDRSHYRRLIVELAYREPVAVVVLEIAWPNARVIDEEAVVLDDSDIDWTSKKTPIRVRGVDEPLIEIRGHPSRKRPKVGIPWKKESEGQSLDEPDLMVLRAARLARFLQLKKQGLKVPREVPDFISIHIPDGPGESFLLKDAHQNWVNWGKAPGDEKPGDPSSEARWEMLLKWVREHGPLNAKDPNYLTFTRNKAELVSRKK